MDASSIHDHDQDQDQSDSGRDNGNYNFPQIYLGQHDSARGEPLSDVEYGHLLNLGFTFVTAPITNHRFYTRVLDLVRTHLQDLPSFASTPAATTVTPRYPDPVVPPITAEDTGLYPGNTTRSYTAYSSPWIDIASENPVISSVSRQILNLEINYANFCGVRTVIVPGPRQDGTTEAGRSGLARYARAIKEALSIAPRINLSIHLPMYREPGLEEKIDSLTTSLVSVAAEAEGPSGDDSSGKSKEIDLFSSWDSWDEIRSFCEYNFRLSLCLRLPKRLPERDLQTRWVSEPVHIISADGAAFARNKGNYPCLGPDHQSLIHEFLLLKTPPYVMLCDVGPGPSDLPTSSVAGQFTQETLDTAFPSLADAHASQSNKAQKQEFLPGAADYVRYMKWLEDSQVPQSDMEFNTLTTFQDWLQSPLQPLSDNLESATYEVFEGDPVKYNQYEEATKQALLHWRREGKPTSSESGAVVIAVAGSGRGPLVHRALKASEATGVPVEVWAVEKNPNAYVYLLRRNAEEWSGKVRVVRTDMRSWSGPLLSKAGEVLAKYGKVDILISELLGSFADNELSPECLDGIQHVIAPSGISIPSSYTAYMSPISTPRIHAELLSRAAADDTSFDTPWVVRLFQIDFAARKVPGHPRYQLAWEFSHPVFEETWKQMVARGEGGLIGGVGGSMEGSVGANEHNARFCRTKFVCFHRGVTHGLAGYFESTLFECEGEHATKVEISTHPERIDQKSKDMISWFPIFFPLKRPLHYPDDSELEVTMWRQTDDKSVWYEWMVEAYCWTSEGKRLKVGSSDLCSSRSVACKML
ncbi:related to SHK1 KINASE-BINDING protein [Cephalotrichum gorgonifer]|uniref:Protein arginine N-methyltransferase n=1 Tax=Cephalotrichum gorgonifer TaxID=2041049 RepID=A0AAE8SWN2_9PEZI|nr:related to SHK1 KINASE-BINDING protein [Cephalotrichum gorgonifer]